MPEPYNGPYPRPKSVVMSRPGQRVSDAERNAVVEQLRLNMTEGRIDLYEFSERTEKAHAAKTAGELTPLLSDLAYVSTPRAPRSRVWHPGRVLIVPYLVVNMALALLWAVFGHGWIWASMGWLLGMLVALVCLAVARARPATIPVPTPSTDQPRLT